MGYNVSGIEEPGQGGLPRLSGLSIGKGVKRKRGIKWRKDGLWL